MWLFLLLSICISFDVYVCMLEKGATSKDKSLKHALGFSGVFTLVDIGMFAIGHAVSRYFWIHKFSKFNIFISIIIFLAIGMVMICYALKKHKFVERLHIFSYKDIFKQALFTSLDCLLVGIGCSYLNLSIFMEILILGLSVMIGSLIHYFYGYYNGAGFQRVYYSICGAVYLAIAVVLTYRFFVW